MNNNFLSHENFTYIINYVFRDVKNNTDVDISSDKKYISILKKLIQTIYKKNLNKNVSTEFLNNLVIDKGIPFIVKQLKKDNRNKNVVDFENKRKITYSQRPVSSDVKKNSKKFDYSNLELEGDVTNINNSNMSGISTRDDKVDFSRKMNEFQNDRKYESPDRNRFERNNEIIGKNTKNEDNTDIMAKLKELQNDRGYQAPQQEELSNQSLNENQNENENEQFEIKSSLMNKLYENNSNMNENMNESNLNQRMNESSLNQNKIFENKNIVENDFNNSKNSEELKGESNKSYFSYDNSLDNYSVSINPLKTMKNLEMNIQDTSNEIENSENDSIENLKETQMRELSKSNAEEYINSTLMSTNYISRRQKKHVMSLDISSDLPDIETGRKAIVNISNNYWHRFKVNLIEPLILDSIYDVYLESITINNPARAGNNNLYYVIDIEEFNIKTNTNNLFMMDKFIIPNENTTGSGDNKIMKYHLKSNYLASVNPTKLNSLTYTITNENNESVNNFLVSTTNTTSVNTPYNIGVTAVAVTDSTGLSNNDLIYNRNGVFVGIATTIIDGTNITFGAGILIPLAAGDELFTGNPVNNVKLNNNNFYTTNAAINNTNTIVLTKLAGTNNLVSGDKLFTIDGSYVGQIRQDDPANGIVGVTINSLTQLTILLKENVNLPLTNTQVLFNINPNNMIQVFSSNSTSNRLIMEFIMVSR